MRFESFAAVAATSAPLSVRFWCGSGMLEAIIKVGRNRRVEGVPRILFFVEPSSPLSQAFNPHSHPRALRKKNQWSAGHNYKSTPVLVLTRWPALNHLRSMRYGPRAISPYYEGQPQSR